MRNDLRALSAAAALHVAAAIVLVSLSGREKPFHVEPPPPLAETEIDVTPDPAPAPERAPEPEPEPALDSPSLVSGTRVATSELVSESRESSIPREPMSDRAPPSAASSAPPSVVSGPADIGLDVTVGATNPFLARGALPDLPPRPHVPAEKTGTARPPAPTKEEAQARANAMMRAPARAREAELGLGPEGPVLTALSMSTHGTATPVQGHAVFLAVADATGLVVKIDVLSSDGAKAAWNDTAKKAIASLQDKRLRLPSSAKGAQMTIDVTSNLKMPSGHDPGTRVELFNIPLSEGGGPHSTTISIFGGSALELRGDPVDIGAKAQRVVHAKLVSSSML